MIIDTETRDAIFAEHRDAIMACARAVSRDKRSHTWIMIRPGPPLDVQAVPQRVLEAQVREARKPLRGLPLPPLGAIRWIIATADGGFDVGAMRIDAAGPS